MSRDWLAPTATARRQMAATRPIAATGKINLRGFEYMVLLSVKFVFSYTRLDHLRGDREFQESIGTQARSLKQRRVNSEASGIQGVEAIVQQIACDVHLPRLALAPSRQNLVW